jgi:DNA polymerase III subunit chi
MAIKVRFASIHQAQRKQQMRRLCKLLESRIAEGKTVAVLVPDDSWARRFSELLWTFDDASFVPHGVSLETASPMDRLLLVSSHPSGLTADVLVNFCPQPVAEGQLDDEECEVFELFQQDQGDGRTVGKQKWDWYRNRGITPEKGSL